MRRPKAPMTWTSKAALAVREHRTSRPKARKNQSDQYCFARKRSNLCTVSCIDSTKACRQDDTP